PHLSRCDLTELSAGPQADHRVINGFFGQGYA
ncbi:MAG: hypothetical protein ACI9VX_001646, partial [Dinoroseobacter sp.]